MSFPCPIPLYDISSGPRVFACSYTSVTSVIPSKGIKCRQRLHDLVVRNEDLCSPDRKDDVCRDIIYILFI